MVSNEISIPMVVEDEKAAGQDKSNKIILIKNFVARRIPQSIFLTYLHLLYSPIRRDAPRLLSVL
jgi:hypothetical protein